MKPGQRPGGGLSTAREPAFGPHNPARQARLDRDQTFAPARGNVREPARSADARRPPRPHESKAPMRFRLSLFALLGLSALAAASDISTRDYRSDDTLLRMGPYRFDNGRIVNLSVGIGSGAFRHPDDPPNVIWTVGDRGPNIACGEFKQIAQMEMPACRETKNGRIYLAPSYAPSIYRVLLLD